MLGTAVKGLIVAVCMLIAATSTPGASAAAEPRLEPGRIGGIVATPDHAPVAEANVALVHDGRVVARTTTDAEGRYRFDRVRPGRYVVRAAKPDVGQGRERAAVRPGQTVRVRIVLKQ